MRGRKKILKEKKREKTLELSKEDEDIWRKGKTREKMMKGKKWGRGKK